MNEVNGFEIRVPTYSSDRYLVFDIDGTCSYIGFTQRPAAIRAASHNNKGLYDTRTDTVVLKPNVDNRLADLQRNIEHAEEELVAAQRKAEKCKATADEARRLAGELEVDSDSGNVVKSGETR